MINYSHLVPHMSLLTAIHYGDELPLMPLVDNFAHWVEQFIRNFQLLVIRMCRFRILNQSLSITLSLNTSPFMKCLNLVLFVRETQCRVQIFFSG